MTQAARSRWIDETQPRDKHQADNPIAPIEQRNNTTLIDICRDWVTKSPNGPRYHYRDEHVQLACTFIRSGALLWTLCIESVITHFC
ncbi:protein of unknown function [Burkholderia multivorans]